MAKSGAQSQGLAAVAAQCRGAHVTTLGGDAAQDFGRSVGRTVVDENDFETCCLAARLEHAIDPVAKFFDTLRLVVDRHHDGVGQGRMLPRLSLAHQSSPPTSGFAWQENVMASPAAKSRILSTVNDWDASVRGGTVSDRPGRRTMAATPTAGRLPPGPV